MGVYDYAAAPAASIRQRRWDFGVGAVLARSAEWMQEFPGLVRGLYELAKPFRWHLLVILGFNIAIAGWETAQPLILAWGVDTFQAHAPYLEMVAIIVYPILMIAVPHGIVLPFARDLYSMWFVRPRFEKHVGLLCLAREQSRERSLVPEVQGRKAPIVQEGRGAAFGLVEMMMRDPAFAVRGLVVMVILCFMSPMLVGLLLVGIVADLWVTLLMDARLFRPYAVLQEHEFRVRGLEFQLFDGAAGAGRDEFQKRSNFHACSVAWDSYVGATRYAELRRMIYQVPIRETISQLVRVGSMLLVAWWVHTGEVTIGEYIFFVQLAGRANDPLFVFLGFQNRIMTTRESIRRLGIMTGIDFGISRPADMAKV
jgi:ABC-type multidrug transport system fused ATPase/permease subunit